MKVRRVYTKREKEIKYGTQGLFLMYGFPSLITIFMYVTGLEILSSYIYLVHAVKYICLLPVLFYFFMNKDIKRLFFIGILFISVLIISGITFGSINRTIINALVYFVAYTMVNIVCISLLKDPDVILEKFRYIAYIGCIEVIVACVFGNILHLYNAYIDYMVLGNGGLIYASVLLFWTIKEKKIWEIILSCLVIICYVLFTSRGALGALGGVVLYYLFLGDMGAASKKRIGWIIGLSSIGAILLINIRSIFEFIITIAQEKGWSIGKLLQAYLYFDNSFQSQSRMEIWEKAIVLIKRSWLTGYGPMSSARVLDPYSYAHNMELDILLDFGVVLGGAFILLIFMLLITLLCTKKYRRWSSVCAVFVLPGFWVLQLSSYWYSVSYIFLLFFLFIFARKECQKGSGGRAEC